MADELGNIWALISFTEDAKMRPQFVTAESPAGQRPFFTYFPRAASLFNSRAAAIRFLKRIEAFGVYPVNIGALGFE